MAGLTHGTTKLTLMAARFPAWPGSRARSAWDPAENNWFRPRRTFDIENQLPAAGRTCRYLPQYIRKKTVFYQNILIW